MTMHTSCVALLEYKTCKYIDKKRKMFKSKVTIPYTLITSPHPTSIDSKWETLCCTIWSEFFIERKILLRDSADNRTEKSHNRRQWDDRMRLSAKTWSSHTKRNNIISFYTPSNSSEIKRNFSQVSNQFALIADRKRPSPSNCDIFLP